MSKTFSSSAQPCDAAPGRVSRIDCRDSDVVEKIALAVSALIAEYGRTQDDNSRVILCVGSDRSTGDALGPLVGTYLSRLQLPRTLVRGTLAKPVHALNLASCINEFKSGSRSPLVVAVDASLGKPENVGLIEIGRGPLYPGAGVNKKLPPVGNIYLSGIVNLGGFMEQMVLQSTRLFHVMEIATAIGRGLHKALVFPQHSLI